MKNYLKNWNDFLDKAVTLLMDDPIKVEDFLYLMRHFYFFSPD